MEDWQLLILGSILGFVFALTSAIINNWMNNKQADERMKLQFEHEQKQQNNQLIYQDRKKSIDVVYNQIATIRTGEQVQELIELLTGVQGQYLPNDIRDELLNKLKGFIEWARQNDPEEHFYEQYISMIEDYEDEQRLLLDPVEVYEADYNERMVKLRSECKHITTKGLRID